MAKRTTAENLPGARGSSLPKFIAPQLATLVKEPRSGDDWVHELKFECSKRQEFIIAAYTDSSKGLPGFGALILGVYEEGRLVYAGRVGTGFTIKRRIDLKHRLDQFSHETSAFSVLPKDPGLREAHWIEPRLIAEVSLIEWTSDGSIRHLSFQESARG